MNWRPWIIAAGMFGAIVVNSALLWFERIDPPEGAAGVTDVVRDPLLDLKFGPGHRLKNLKDMTGGNEKIANAAAGKIKKLQKREDFYREKIKEYSDEVSTALCPGSGLPQRYAVLAIIVEQDGERKKVLQANQITYFETREWWADSLVPQVYDALELDVSRKGDATLMGLSGILAGQEELIMNSEAPFNYQGIGWWSWDGVLKRWPDVESRVVDYLALMHFLVEIATDVEGGICSPA